ncbi:hypothetical protein VB834_19335 [Limnoraphis robusta Tam1]|uniref:hypothetical protein n=1 Tax=Limnoraphis robusta TaxID=1118279 RepID=UPI002B20E289|nr:hypothetical protein [Limnoraphis robusta]MEA5497000.1 hypothetical protein [Limnoraphis robusta BA-68 BA1]MEA5541182.1 hypothetical protein [Limnoraphis robusta Tam1]
MSQPITIPQASEELIDFIASGATPQQIVSFQASEPIKERVRDLIEREKTTGLSTEEKSELNQFLQLEHLMRLIKARAYQYIEKQ